MKLSIAVLLTLAPCTPAPPGKNTIAADDPMVSMEFLLRYLPATVAEDNGVGNVGHGATQGRTQALQEGSYTAPNCQLYSADGSKSSSSGFQSMTTNGLGSDCTYKNNNKYGNQDAMWKVYANNEVQCCNACIATSGCVAATFETSSKDHSGGRGPQSWEGFGIHLPDVTNAKTTGGITVGELKAKYSQRFGDFQKFDAFMDYSVTFFVHDLQHYVDLFKTDGIKHFLGSWSDSKSRAWYSMIFQVPSSTYVIELVSAMQPSGNSDLPQMEQRMSDAHCDKFRNKGDSPAKNLLIASINRASADMSAIDNFMTLVKAKTTLSVKTSDVTRKCFSYSSSSDEELEDGPPGPTSLDEDVCFTSRASDAEQDSAFSVQDHEEMMWAAHAGTLGNNPNSKQDKYTDSHYALPLPRAGLTALASHFQSNSPYPITKNTRLAYACEQNYIIDPTGFCIQPIGPANWPDCGWDEVSV